MWTYQQSTGELRRDGVRVASGYSGHDVCRNNPCRQDVPMHGPIPRGKYSIGDLRDTELHGPYVMRLHADPANRMFGRDGFLIHGDSVGKPGAASEGCIVLARSIRLVIGTSGDHELSVIE